MHVRLDCEIWLCVDRLQQSLMYLIRLYNSLRHIIPQQGSNIVALHIKGMASWTVTSYAGYLHIDRQDRHQKHVEVLIFYILALSSVIHTICFLLMSL